VHEGWKQEMRERPFSVLSQDPVMVLGHGHAEGRAFALPARDQLVERPWIDDGAGQDMRANLAPLLENADGQFAACLGRKLFQPDRRREPRGTGSTITTSYCIDSRSLTCAPSVAPEGQFGSLWRSEFLDATGYGG